MPTFIKANGINVVFAASWLPPGETKKAAEKFAKQRKADFRLAFGLGNKQLFAVLRANNKAAAKGKIVSGAALFSMWATAYDRDNASELSGPGPGRNMLVLRLKAQSDNSDGEVSVIALLGNQIYRDVVVKQSEVNKTISDIEREVGERFELFSDLIDAFPESTPIELKNILSQDTKPALMNRIAKLNVTVMAYATAGILAVAAVSAGVVIHNRNVAREIAEAEPVKVDPIAQYKTSVLQALKRARFSGKDAQALFWGAMEKIDTPSAGFQLQTVFCDAKGCMQTWKRLNGTSAEFVHDHKGAGIVSMTDEETMTVFTALKTVPTAIDLKILPSESEFKLFYVSLDQSLKALSKEIPVTYKVDAAKVFGLPPGVPAKLIPPGVAIKSGGFLVSSPLGFYPGMFNDLSLNISIKSLNIDFRNSQVTLLGEYFAK